MIHDPDLNTLDILFKWMKFFCHQPFVTNMSSEWHLSHQLFKTTFFRLIKINGSFIYISAVITWYVPNVSCTDQIQTIRNSEIGDWNKVNVQFVTIGQKSFVDRIIKWTLLKKRKKKFEKLLIFLIGNAEIQNHTFIFQPDRLWVELNGPANWKRPITLRPG